MLSHAGVCMSHTSIWAYLMKLTQDAGYAEQVQQGHWTWVYDNLNLQQHIRHEREGITFSMCTCWANDYSFNAL